MPRGQTVEGDGKVKFSSKFSRSQARKFSNENFIPSVARDLICSRASASSCQCFIPSPAESGTRDPEFQNPSGHGRRGLGWSNYIIPSAPTLSKIHDFEKCRFPLQAALRAIKFSKRREISLQPEQIPSRFPAPPF